MKFNKLRSTYIMDSLSFQSYDIIKVHLMGELFYFLFFQLIKLY